MAGFDVDAESFGESGRQLEQAATTFAEALSAFQSELEGFARPWGADDIGSLIGAAHDEVGNFAFECYGDALEEIANAGFDLSAAGDAYREVEDGIDQGFSELHGEMGG